MARTKRWWLLHCGVGAVVVLSLLTAVTQCSIADDVDEARAATEKKLQEFKGAVDSLQNENKDLRNNLGAARGALVNANDDRDEALRCVQEKDDTIAQLKDSLALVKSDLEDCQSGKKPQKQVKKPVKKVKKVKKQKKQNVVRQNRECSGGNRGTRVQVNNESANNGAVVVNKGCQDRSGVNVSIDNGSVNNGAIVVGCGNNVVVNRTVEAAKARFEQTREVTVECEVISTRRVYR